MPINKHMKLLDYFTRQIVSELIVNFTLHNAEELGDF